MSFVCSVDGERSEGGDDRAVVGLVDVGADLLGGEQLQQLLQARVLLLAGALGLLTAAVALAARRDAVPEALDSAMKKSALSHLTAVSGANCAVIIGLVMFGGALVGLRRTSRILASLVVLAGFVVWQSRNRKEPLLPLKIFRDRNFSLANGGIVQETGRRPFHPISFVARAYGIPEQE